MLKYSYNQIIASLYGIFNFAWQMPKKSVVDKITVFEVLCASKEAVIKNGNISTPSDDIWQNLCKQLGEKMTPKALYTFVKSNRHNVWAALDYSNEKSVTDTDSSDNDNDFEPSSSPLKKKRLQDFQCGAPIWTVETYDAR